MSIEEDLPCQCNMCQLIRDGDELKRVKSYLDELEGEFDELFRKIEKIRRKYQTYTSRCI